jgi:hypothetical protein
MAFTTCLHLSKPDQGTQRYDLELNSNADIIDAALRMFPGDDPPGSVSNYPDVVPSNGLRWLDTANGQVKVYYSASWHVLNTL